MVKIWLDFNFAEAYLNTSLFINIKIIIIIYLLFNYLRTGPFLFAIATRLLMGGIEEEKYFSLSRELLTHGKAMVP